MFLIDKITLTKDNVEDVVEFCDHYDARFCKLYKFNDGCLSIYPRYITDLGSRKLYCNIGDTIKAYHAEHGYIFSYGSKTKIMIERDGELL